ncbi:hypothetical protein K439DRAFT_1638845 [Ramaria rubella]|nr:hypothetical protein K439DRAFT_1638845 [Ramaria rubella]
MARRLANKVHQQASRLMQAGLIRSPPRWFQAVMDNPPLPLPPRTPPERNSYDLPPQTPASRHSPTAHHVPSKHLRTPRPRPLPVHYLEDEIRRQFFKDRPFQAFRATTLVENGEVEEEHPISGEAWTRLRQRGRNPTAEDAVRFAMNLHTVHNQSLSVAYRAAVLQFDALRSEQYIMNCFAVLEAEAHGAEFRSGEIERGFAMEEKALESWEQTGTFDAGVLAARKRWKAIVEKRDPGEWTRGQRYVRLWKEGIRPDYSPILTVPTLPAAAIEPPQEVEHKHWMSHNSS